MLTTNEIKKRTQKTRQMSWELRMLIVDYMNENHKTWQDKEQQWYQLAQIAYELQDMINDLIE